MYNLLIIKIICAISPYAWYSCHAHMYLLAYITIRVDIASIPNFINYKKHHLARNETLIWNFIGSLWFLLIVVHRYVVNSGLMTVMKEEPLHIQSIFLYLFGMWRKTSINCFVMIAGYFMCKSHISLRNHEAVVWDYFYNLLRDMPVLLSALFFTHWYRYKVLEWISWRVSWYSICWSLWQVWCSWRGCPLSLLIKIYMCFGLWPIVTILWLWLLLFARLCISRTWI